MNKRPGWAVHIDPDEIGQWLSSTDAEALIASTFKRGISSFEALQQMVIGLEWDLLVRPEQPSDEELVGLAEMVELGRSARFAFVGLREPWGVIFEVSPKEFARLWLLCSIAECLAFPIEGNVLVGNSYSDLYFVAGERTFVRRFSEIGKR